MSKPNKGGEEVKIMILIFFSTKKLWSVESRERETSGVQQKEVVMHKRLAQGRFPTQKSNQQHTSFSAPKTLIVCKITKESSGALLG
jgi:hypothetical protein